MLTPDYLENCSKDIIEKYAELERRIIKDIARRIAGADFKMTESARWQIKISQEAGILYDDIINQVSIYTNNTKSEIKKLFEDSAIESIKVDDDIYKKVGLNPIPIKQDKVLLNVLLNGLNKTNGIMNNLTQTTAQTMSDTFVNILDNAYMQISTGAFDYNTTIIKAINELADNGIKVINYSNGRKDQLEVAVRRALLTGVNQTSSKMQEARADEMDSDLVETTAHSGARPEHAEWQGKIFSRSGKDKKYPKFVENTGYGTAGGLCGVNCRHSFYPFFEGISIKAYTSDEIEKYNEKNITYDGKKYTEYEATQIQRKAERTLRATKRELAGYDGIIQSNANIELIQHAQIKFDVSSIKLKQQNSKLEDFINQTNLRRDKSREQIVEFNKKISAKVTWNNKKIIKNTKKHDIINIDKLDIEGITKEGEIGLKNAFNTALNHGLINNTETLLNISKETGKYVTKKHDGVKSMVILSDEDIDVLKTSPKNSIICIHNHPGNSSFSDSDMKIMTKFESISDLTVIGHDNTLYTLSVTSGIRPKLNIITEDYCNIKNIKNIKYNELVKNNILTQKQAWHEHSNEIVEEMAKKYGWKYRRYELNEQKK